MSDERLRELERRWKETGAVEDEAAFLLERVRAGELTKERLAVAGYLGHDGARQALGSLPPVAVLSNAHACEDWLQQNQARLEMLPDEPALSFLAAAEYPPRAPASVDGYVGWAS